MNICPRCGSQAIANEACLSCGFAAPRVAGFEAFAPDMAMAGPGFDPEHYAALAALESGNFWFQSRNALIVWAFRKFFPQSRSYLEVGCGTGFVLEAIAKGIPGLQVHGSEIFIEGLGFAKQRLPGAHLFQMDATCIPYSGTFDVIGAFDVIEHIDNDVLVLQQMYRALRPGGGIILTVPQHQWLWSSQDEIAHHVRRYNRRDLAEKVRNAGFRVAWTSSFVSFLLPAMAASRARKRSHREVETDVFSEFKLSRGLNAAMLKVMQLELGFIKAGFRFPVGGSRILIAYRNDP